MNAHIRKLITGTAISMLAIGTVTQGFAQPAPDGAAPAAGAPAGRAAGGGGGGRQAETWWVNKTKGGVYHAPMRPLWKLSDLKKMHAGKSNWSQQIIKDPEQEATYNSAAPGTTFSSRMHPDTPTLFVVIAGEVHFTVEGQQPAIATRGALVNIMKTTVYSYEVAGTQNALWVEVDPADYKTVYPSSDPKPEASKGGEIVKIAFGHRPAPYTGINKLMINTFDDTIGKCLPRGADVMDDHLFANPLVGYLNPADNKCGTGAGNVGQPDKPGDPPFQVKGHQFGHMHAGPAEWWIVQVGGIEGRFENAGLFHATEGDVLYASPMSWHEMAAEATSGPSVRLAMGGYQLINMQNTAGGGGD